MERIEISDDIKNAQRGSKIYLLIDKIAYNLYKICQTNNPKEDWFKAQEILQRFVDLEFKTDPGYNTSLKLDILLKSAEDSYQHEDRHRRIVRSDYESLTIEKVAELLTEFQIRGKF